MATKINVYDRNSAGDIVTDENGEMSVKMTIPLSGDALAAFNADAFSFYIDMMNKSKGKMSGNLLRDYSKTMWNNAVKLKSITYKEPKK